MNERELNDREHPDEIQMEDADAQAETPPDVESPFAGEQPVEAEILEEDAAGGGEASLQDGEAARLAAENAELRDQLLRARAEFDNYRKRMARDAERTRKLAAERLLRELLPVLDNLEMALLHAADPEDGLAQGVGMVLKQLSAALSAEGLQPIEALAAPFDPNVHEALTQEPSEETPAGHVLREFQRGYTLGDFVLRPAKVVVSAGPPETPQGDTAAESADGTGEAAKSS